MSESTLVTTNLLRFYRPIGLWLGSAMIVGIGIALTAVLSVGDLRFSLWLMIVGSAAKYWLLAVGIMLTGMHLRQYVSAGVTRHEFLAGAGLFGLVTAVLFAAAVIAGHGLEQWAVGLAGPLSPDYPAIAPVTEYLHVLPVELGYLVSGTAITAGFYRFGALPGLLVLVPGMLPAAVSEALLAGGPHGESITRVLPFGFAVAVSLVVTAVGAVACHRLIRDVAIRRATG